jgi:hypothetical protein
MTLVLEHDFNRRRPDGTYSVWLRDADETPAIGADVWLSSENEGMLRGRVLAVSGEFARVEVDYSTWIDTSVVEFPLPSASMQAQLWTELSDVVRESMTETEPLLTSSCEWLPYAVKTSGWVTITTTTLTPSASEPENESERPEIDLVRWAAAHRSAA